VVSNDRSEHEWCVYQEGLLGDIVGMSTNNSITVGNIYSQSENDNSKQIPMMHMEECYFMRSLNKNIVTNTEYSFMTVTKAENKQKIYWFSTQVQNALKHNDLSMVWVTDSGSTKHKEWMSELKPVNAGVKMAGGYIMPCKSIDKVSLTVVDENDETSE
jgi:hypothetical protein